MSERREFRPPRPTKTTRGGVRRLLAGLTVTALVAGCSATSGADEGGQDAAVVTTVTAPVSTSATGGATGVELASPPPAAPGGAITVVAPPTGTADPIGPASTPGNASDVSATTSSVITTSAATPSAPPKPKPKPAATVSTTPGPGAVAIDPRQKITVRAKGGTIVSVKVINPEGKVVGHAAVNAASWSWLPELGFGRKYIVRTTSKSTAGVVATTDSTFTTLHPKRLVSATVTPSNGSVVGVGQPIVIRFSAPIADIYRRRVEAMIKIDRTIGQAGAFRWFSSSEVHWRPAQYWKGGSKVKVSLDIYARTLSPGSYGKADLVSKFSVGPRVTSIVDAKKHTMEVYKDFKLIRVIPVSLGNNKYPTYNGIHVVTEKYREYVMDSSTWGLKGVGAYRTKVKYATRISDSGEFVHGAPWSVYAQGKSNVSHGCINMTDAAAKWFQDLSRPGDVVIVKNSVGTTMAVGDRYGDWNQPWGKY